ncbi:MAG: FAD-dependent oxidoreductase [Dysgonamonadaceae bacterium]|jgi:ribulose 1,5-bisphosphate synthetase/thiazole synthase|nr:FAD-dependent oxidoreductase [Dysgonamonadaceae bacterium]
MKNLRQKIVYLLAVITTAVSCNSRNSAVSVDICIYGGTSAGVIAAYTAAKSGKKVILIEPGRNLGGMSSGGLGFTDIGNKYVVQGLALDFYRRLGMHYGKLEQWIFEPGVAEAQFNDYIKEANIEVWYENRVTTIKKEGTRITEIEIENSKAPSAETNRRLQAKVFIDCSYEGDLMARAGASYFVGREANSLYGETYNGVQLMDRHQVPDGIDPYIIPGDPTSGVIYGINPEPVLPNGTGDKKVQAYCFRTCLTNDPDNMIPITRPDNYDPSRYELLKRIKEKYPWKQHTDAFIWTMMPNNKTDINNMGGFSMDMIGENQAYPDAGYDERERIIKLHEDYTKGLFYFIGNDPGVPENIRRQMRQWGYPKDEYPDNNHWSPQLYVREARRLIGETVMTQNHCQGRETVTDPIGWAAYTMDSHNCDRHVVNVADLAMIKNEGNVEIGGFGPYPIAYRSITPKQSEVTNLLVPVCISASHIAYGSIRMEPVFMVLGQSAAIAAVLAIDKCDGVVQRVASSEIRNEFRNNPLADGSQPEILVDNSDKDRVTITGEWKREEWKAYGPDFLSDDSKGAVLKAVKYSPGITKDNDYDLYVYFPKVDKASSHTEVTVFDGQQKLDMTINAADIVVVGQTSGEWVNIGRFRLTGEKECYVEISNKGADGIIVADAVLFKPAGAEVKLSGFFSDHMILQRDVPVKIRGEAGKNEQIEVRFNRQTLKTRSNNDGKWEAVLSPTPCGGPYTMTVTGENNVVELHDILNGDIWLCSGQSNMEWTVGQSDNAAEEIANAGYPQIRSLRAPKSIKANPQNDFTAEWQVCSPSAAGQFSGVAYFYARELYRKLNIPIGIINASWGGTDIETWMSIEAFNALPETVRKNYNPEVVANLDTYINRNTGSMQAFLEAMKTDPAMDAGWFSPDFKSSAWELADVPCEWSTTPLSLIDGHIWFKYDITLPAVANGKSAVISLGAIDDNEITWINGVEIGRSEGWDTPRYYNVPPGVLKKGKNNITVKITDTGGSGGMWSPSEDLYLELQGGSKDKFSLAGKWMYKASVTNAQYNVLDVSPNMLHSSLYNTMINPLTSFPIKGVIWYQGENNVGAADNYRSLFPAMINDWRSKWGYDFPFYWVQLANLYPEDNNPKESAWAELREAQTMTLSVPKTGQVVIYDIGNPNDIHPTNKQEVGRRLSLIALNKDYKHGAPVYSGPTFKSVEFTGNKAIVTMDTHGSSLTSNDKYGYLKGFTIAGADKKQEWAKAEIEGDKIIVYSHKIDKPVAVRYAWANNPGATLFNTEGLPATPFRTDTKR